MGRNPFLNKSLIGRDPIEGYLIGGIWIEVVVYDNDIIANAPANNGGDIASIPTQDANIEPLEGNRILLLDKYHEVQ